LDDFTPQAASEGADTGWDEDAGGADLTGN